MNTGAKRTPLYQEHLRYQGKMVEFAGWELPVYYQRPGSGIIAEHTAVRERAGLFDVSHMGELLFSGPQAERALELLTPNEVKKLYDGKAQYSAFLNERGGVVDDIIVYRFAENKFFVCVNASNCEKDFVWCCEHNPSAAEIENVSSRYGQIALQGPLAEKILVAASGSSELAGVAYFHFVESEVAGANCIIARTGYTGEDGFELFVPWDQTVGVWRKLLEVGEPLGLVPCGLGARDSLRLEACLPLHGHELSDDISALESGLGWIVRLSKGQFFGREALHQEREQGAKRSLVGFEVKAAGIARQGDRILDIEGQEVGVVTSGTKTPTLAKSIGLAFVKSELRNIGQALQVEVRGKVLPIEVIKRPFYSRNTGQK
jgi:aminomethyltransferase